MLSCEYLAGLFDGEGCVRINKNKRTHKDWAIRYDLVTIVVNSNLEVLLQCQKQFGGSVHKRKVCLLKHHSTYSWTLGAKACVKFLTAIYPHSIVKQDAIKIALDYAQAKKNTRGRSELTSKELDLREVYYQMMTQTINK